MFGNALRPVFVPLGFGSGDDGWKVVVAILTGFVAKEAIVATLGQMFSPTGYAGATENTAISAGIAAAFSPAAALSFMVFNLLCMPCIAAVVALHSEMRSRKYFIFTIIMQFVVAWVVAFLVVQVGGLFM